MKHQWQHRVLGLPVLIWMLAYAAPPAVGQTFNVEVDWLKAADHTHKPNICELNAVAAAFTRNGFTLNIEMGDEITETTALEAIDFVTPNEFDNGEWAALETANRDHAAGSGWHYMIFGHNYTYDGTATTSSGLAEINGDEFLVSLASFPSMGSAFDRAGTFMHELGHNLSLRHSGDQDENVVRQFKPNYPSVMTYRYQLIGVRNGIECQSLSSMPVYLYNLDYSHGECTKLLDETGLVEESGIGFGGVDWDCDTMVSGIASKDVSSATLWCSSSGAKSVLKDYDDWGNIESAADTTDASPESVTCMTLEQSNRLLETGCVQLDPCLPDTGSTCEPPECFLVIGDGPGSATYFEIDHLFQTQIGEVEDSYAVLMEDLPEFVLPTLQGTAGLVGPGGQRSSTRGNSASPSWMLDGHLVVQILLWNPAVFPAQPEQYSAGLAVQVLPNGKILTTPYGTSQGGIDVWAEVYTNSQGKKMLRFPFSIVGF